MNIESTAIIVIAAWIILITLMLLNTRTHINKLTEAVNKMGHTEQTHTYEIKHQVIEEPGEGNSAVFVFPKETPRPVMLIFEERLIEMQNAGRKYITTNESIRFIKTKKGKLEVDTRDESSEAEGHPTAEGKGQTKG